LAIQSLKNNPSLVTCKQDKGNEVVLLNKTDYVTKVESLLSDTTKFKKIDSDNKLFKAPQPFTRFFLVAVKK